VVGAFLLTGAIAVVSAQDRTPSAPQARPPETSGQTSTETAQRAAVHELMHGDWEGTISSPGGASNVGLKVAKDEVGKVTFRMTGDRSRQLGLSSQFAVDGKSVRWTQDVSGKACQVSVRVAAAMSKEADVLKGMISCADREMALTLHKDQ